jgi:Skp family chaperone for outer membrane proteins
MKNKIVIIIAVGLLSLLTSCAQMNSHPMDMTQAIQNAKTPSDHEALAKHYEDTAKEMQSKLQEHKKMLETYEANTSHYGRQALDLQAHCRNLINSYEQAVKANIAMANSHRSMAIEIK